MNSGQAATELLIEETPEQGVALTPTLVVTAELAPQATPANDLDAWQVIQVRSRLDAETHTDLMTQIHETLAEGGRYIALELTQNQFFSLNAIQLCMGLARDLANDEGALALVGCSERTKKHFDVYGSLKQIRLVRTLAELVSDRQTAVVMRPRISQDSR